MGARIQGNRTTDAARGWPTRGAILAVALTACSEPTASSEPRAVTQDTGDAAPTQDGKDAASTPGAPDAAPAANADASSSAGSNTDIDAGDASVDPLHGIWLATAWGLALDAADGVLTMYEITEISCRTYLEVPYFGLELPDLGGSAQLESGNLVILLGATDVVTATPLSTLPSTCANGGTPTTDDPQLSFEIFWHNFDEMYPSFDIRHVDWQAQYEAYAPRVTSDTSKEDLFALLCEMTKPFDDPHVVVNLGERSCESHPLPDWLADDVVDQILDAVSDQIYGEGATKTANDRIAYRILPGNIGYVFIPGMGEFADTPQADPEAAAAAIDEILAAFADVDGMIVDIRLNGGGDDGVSLAIANRFADKRRLAFSIQSREGDGWTELRDYYVYPEGPRQFLGPVVLLSSAATLSAAEVFGLTLGVLPNVTLMGEATAGAHATMMYRNLPNGLEYSLPFERTFAADGMTYEGIGVTPDIAVPFDVEAFIQGDDKMLNAALQYLSTG